MIEEFRVKVTIAAPITEVWRELVTWQKQGEWMAMTHVQSSDLGPDDSGIGTTIEAFTGIGKFGILDRMRVTKWEPPQFCEVEHFGKIIKGIGEFRLSEIANGERRFAQTRFAQTRFDWYEKIDAPKLILLLVKPGILLSVFLSLRKFARTFPKV